MGEPSEGVDFVAMLHRLSAEQGVPFLTNRELLRYAFRDEAFRTAIIASDPRAAAAIRLAEAVAKHEKAKEQTPHDTDAEQIEVMAATMHYREVADV